MFCESKGGFLRFTAWRMCIIGRFVEGVSKRVPFEHLGYPRHLPHLRKRISRRPHQPFLYSLAQRSEMCLFGVA